MMAPEELEKLTTHLYTESDLLQNLLGEALNKTQETEVKKLIVQALAKYNNLVGGMLIQLGVGFAGVIQQQRKTLQASSDLMGQQIVFFQEANMRLSRLERGQNEIQEHLKQDDEEYEKWLARQNQELRELDQQITHLQEVLNQQEEDPEWEAMVEDLHAQTPG